MTQLKIRKRRIWKDSETMKLLIKWVISGSISVRSSPQKEKIPFRDFSLFPDSLKREFDNKKISI